MAAVRWELVVVPLSRALSMPPALVGCRKELIAEWSADHGSMGGGGGGGGGAG